ncbi:response regulator transcription factor [Aquabacterium humicola]|uniref:response regulator transcription factor n=1 Tax=Aquabacterium humicola TaxID=3237377 RepID=UPI002542B293|nr:response regulator transcription factor [Rubrivivax pictus]
MPEHHPPPPLDRGAGDLVLIVDDVPDNLSLLHDALDEAGHTVLVARDGPSAIARAQQAKPDVVLLDAMMPGMDGFEVARRLKADPETAAIPIIFMTALTETEHVLAAFGAGGVDYVTKPLEPRQVLARIAAHTQTARAQHQARHALDAFGHATLVVRPADGRLVWQTALARALLRDYFGSAGSAAPVPLIDWLREQVAAVTGAGTGTGTAPQPLVSARGGRRLTLELHSLIGDDPSPGPDEAEWLIVATEADDAAAFDAMMQAFGLTVREAEVLYWVAKGKTNRDVGEILAMSPRTVTKHMEHILQKMDVETRTAAAARVLKLIG